MKLLARLVGGEDEERSPDVHALHAAMRMAADRPWSDAHAAWFALLAQAHLWAITVGQPASPERLMARARLSDHAEMSFRAGRMRDGETYLPAATTRQRLVRSGYGKPGDAMVRLPFRLLAYGAHYGGLDALVVNPGTVPFGHIGGPALTAFADGGMPDPVAPEQRLTLGLDQQGPIESFDIESLPTGLLEAAMTVTRSEPQIVCASLVVRAVGGGRLFVILTGATDDADRQALMDRLAAQLVGLIDPGNYFAVEYVARGDPRLTALGRAAVLIPA